jgi:hypothetical protein
VQRVPFEASGGGEIAGVPFGKLRAAFDCVESFDSERFHFAQGDKLNTSREDELRKN